MPDPTIKWQYAKQVRDEIMAGLKAEKEEDRFTGEDLDKYVKGMRIAVQEIVFMDIQFASDNGVETHMWNIHVVVKNHLKDLLDLARQGPKDRRVVQRRKFDRAYSDYLKSTRKSYENYIQHLASTFGGIPGLERIASCLRLDALSGDQPVIPPSHVEALVLQSCHDTLLRCGDLARYKNEAIEDVNKRHSNAALSYYQLAADLRPDTGSAYNQMAVVAVAEHNHLDTLYYLYRAIAIKEPHPLAAKNLDLEYRKIMTVWEKQQVGHKLDDQSTLILWFVRLHARMYRGFLFTGYGELEATVLSRLSLFLKSESPPALPVLQEDGVDEVLERFVIVNIAAFYYAAERIKDANGGKDDFNQSFFFLLRFNVRFLHVILQTLYPEMETSVSGQDLPNFGITPRPQKRHGMFTTVARRLLPALRQYSTWIVTQADILIKVRDDRVTQVRSHINLTWSMYAEVLSRIAKLYPLGTLPSSYYLLKEDTMTIGFKPFFDPEIVTHEELKFYLTKSGSLKPRYTDHDVQRSSPDAEFLSRVRDILMCAMAIQTQEQCPVLHTPNTLASFTYVEYDGISAAAVGEPTLGSSSISSPDTDSPVKPEESASQPDPLKQAHHTGREYCQTLCSPSSSGFDSAGDMDHMMNEMVNKLVDKPASHRTSDDTSYGMHSRTANEIFGRMGSAGNRSYTHQGSSNIPRLGGIWPSPFTPQPNELKVTSPEMYSFSTEEGKAAAADALDAMTNRPSSNHRGHWAPNVRAATLTSPGHSPRSFPSQSSNFSTNSSIYGNPTPKFFPLNNSFAVRTTEFAPNNDHNTTVYAGATPFDRSTMLNNSTWNDSQPARCSYSQTPPGGQDG
ncbi:hypothetical protein BJ878DRAFT_539624 [Calycina marina]|uniref:Protein SMG7 n=1 Tax=Calycina marina TaxID=1763456 RepID=A0A9P7Z875_9HELO|nr:hypothetical protein BJ878DRAFT_539624 [Calycina marina]